MTENQTASVEQLHAEGIVKRYSGVPALAGVTFTVPRGEIVGLVGHNGAGKSTLLKALAGAHRPSEGTISIDGEVVEFNSPSDALQRGISTVYQELSLLSNLTVTQNVFLGRELKKRGQLDKIAMRQQARELMKRFDLDVDASRKVGDYPVATRQLLEIAIAIGRDAKYLLLDEPTTSLEGEQIDHFLATIKGLAKEHDIGMVLVDHKLDELYEVAEHVVALVDGKVRISGRADAIDRADVVEAIAGHAAATHLQQSGQLDPEALGEHELESVVPMQQPVPPVPTDEQPTLECHDVRGPGMTGVTLRAHRGRILGIYGLIGSGRTEFLRALVGLTPVVSGTIKVNGEDYSVKGPYHAQKKGVVYLTEERKHDGIVPKLDSLTNVGLPVLRKHRTAGVLDVRGMRSAAAELLQSLKLKGDPRSAVVSLSGGNQQKVLIARALAQEPQLLLLDEPTKGVDLGVKSEIHRLLRRLAHEEGLTVIVVSSEEEEILEVADDVVTFTHGACDGDTIPASELTQVELRRAAWDAA